jgi:hypothetical protein
MGLQHRLACGPEKNASLVPYVEKAVWLLDSQVEFIEGRIQNEKVFAECPLRKPEKSSRILKWTNKTVDYVEWIYALCEVLNLNGEKVTLKTLFGVFNGLFGIDVKEYSLYFTGIKNRKKGDRTSFLDLQKQLLIRRMEEADRRPDGKRGLDKRG